MIRMRGGRSRFVVAICAGLIGMICLAASFAGASEPLTPERQAALQRRFDAEIASLSEELQRDPKNLGLYSARGDAYFFRGRFVEAVADYEKMVQLDPAKEADHWRKGIAYFYAGRYQDAAHQF